MTADVQKRKAAEERLPRLESSATAAWGSSILLPWEVGELGTAVQRKNITTEASGDTAFCMPKHYTSYIVRHHTEPRATLDQLSDVIFGSIHLP